MIWSLGFNYSEKLCLIHGNILSTLLNLWRRTSLLAIHLQCTVNTVVEVSLYDEVKMTIKEGSWFHISQFITHLKYKWTIHAVFMPCIVHLYFVAMINDFV